MHMLAIISIFHMVELQIFRYYQQEIIIITRKRQNSIKEEEFFSRKIVTIKVKLYIFQHMLVIVETK